MTKLEWVGVLALVAFVGLVGGSLLSGVERAEHRQFGASNRVRMLTAVAGVVVVLLILVVVLKWVSPSVAP